jgi:hypothetical protein
MTGRARHSERGAILIQVAVVSLVLFGIAAFVIDYGIFWLSRGQAQNAADAGAMAAAVALAFDDYDNREPSGPAVQAAVAAAALNPVWATPPLVNPASDVTFPADVVSCPDNGIVDDPRFLTGRAPCVRVDVHQTLPTYFATLLGVMSQTVRATAMARFASANATDCVAPLAIADRWAETTPLPIKLWHASSNDLADLPSFDKYIGPDLLKPGLRDQYAAPTAAASGNGFRNDQPGGPGFPLTLRELPDTYPAIKRGQFIAVDLPRADTSAVDAVQASIEGCNGIPIGVGTGESVTPLTGSAIGSVLTAANNLLSRDPSASWNPTTKSIQNSCAMSTPPCAAFSPRLIGLPVFDVSEYDRTRWPGSTLNLRIVNVIGFFIDEVVGGPDPEIRGHVTWYPGLINANAPSIAYTATFLRTAVLMR